MATPIDHMEHRTSPHMVMGKSCGVLLQCGFPVFFSNITFYGFAGGLPDSAALCATDLTSEVCGSEVQCKTSHGHCSVPGIIKPAAVSFALFDNRHCWLNAPVSVAFPDLCIKCRHKRHVVLACNTGRSNNAIYPRAFPVLPLFAFSIVLDYDGSIQLLPNEMQ